MLAASVHIYYMNDYLKWSMSKHELDFYCRAMHRNISFVTSGKPYRDKKVKYYCARIVEWCESNDLPFGYLVCYLISFSFFRHFWKEWEEKKMYMVFYAVAIFINSLVFNFMIGINSQFWWLFSSEKFRTNQTKKRWIATTTKTTAAVTTKKKEMKRKRKRKKIRKINEKFQTIYAKWSIDKLSPLLFHKFMQFRLLLCGSVVVAARSFIRSFIHTFNAHRQARAD